MIFFFFFAKDSLKSTLQFGIRKNVICERKVCLPAADAFVFSRPDGRLGDQSHSIKASFWLSFYPARERYLSLSQHFFTQFCLLYNLVQRKIIYAYVKYVYEAPKNGQTVVTATQCAELQHKSSLLV